MANSSGMVGDNALESSSHTTDSGTKQDWGRQYRCIAQAMSRSTTASGLFWRLQPAPNVRGANSPSSCPSDCRRGRLSFGIRSRALLLWLVQFTTLQRQQGLCPPTVCRRLAAGTPLRDRHKIHWTCSITHGKGGGCPRSAHHGCCASV